MNITEVKKRVAEIEELKDSDPAAARSKRDELYVVVLEATSRRHIYPHTLAKTALKAQEIVLR